MREIRLYGSEGGGAEINRSFLPLSPARSVPPVHLAQHQSLFPRSQSG